jgi:hypothetical protein
MTIGNERDFSLPHHMIETFGKWEIGMSNDDVVGSAFLGGTATCGHGNIESWYLTVDSDGAERSCP